MYMKTIQQIVFENQLIIGNGIDEIATHQKELRV